MRLGIAIVGLIAAGLATLFLQRRRGDHKAMRRPRREERPPIRVRNKKLFFDHDREWKRDGSDRKWKPDHPHGNPTSNFEVTLITPSGKSFPTFHAREVTIEVTIDGTTRPFRLLHEGAVPTLTSSVDLEPTDGRRRLKFKVDKEVWISRVRGDGAVKWEFDSTEPQIVFEAQPRR